MKGSTTFDISFSPRLVSFLFLHFHKRLRGFSSHQFPSFKQATGNASVHWFASNTLPRDDITAITSLCKAGHSTRAIFEQRQRPPSSIIWEGYDGNWRQLNTKINTEENLPRKTQNYNPANPEPGTPWTWTQSLYISQKESKGKHVTLKISLDRRGGKLWGRLHHTASMDVSLALSQTGGEHRPYVFRAGTRIASKHASGRGRGRVYPSGWPVTRIAGRGRKSLIHQRDGNGLEWSARACV